MKTLAATLGDDTHFFYDEPNVQKCNRLTWADLFPLSRLVLLSQEPYMLGMPWSIPRLVMDLLRLLRLYAPNSQC